MQCEETTPRNDQFEADEPVHRFQVAKQFDLLFGSRSEIGMPSFARDDNVAVASPPQDGFTQTRARSDEGLGTLRRQQTFIESAKVFGCQARQGIASGLQVVKQHDMPSAELAF